MSSFFCPHRMLLSRGGSLKPRLLVRQTWLCRKASDVARWDLEETSLSQYRSKHYYPVRIGQVLNDQYRIITKLGYGAYSTSWLARDEKYDG